MLGLGLGISRVIGYLLPSWLRAYNKRVNEDAGADVEARACVRADGKYLTKTTRGGVHMDTLGNYSTQNGGDGLQDRDHSAQVVNDLFFDPKPQARFMFFTEDEDVTLENYYCLSNDVDDLEGQLAVTGVVTHTYGSNDSNGRVALTVKNGTSPYTYKWSNGSTSRDITGLTKGDYRVQVKDADGNIANNSFTVRGDAALEIAKQGLRMDNTFDASELTFPAAGSAEFDGSSDYILIKEDGKGTAFDTQEFTIGAWVYAELNQNNVIWSYDFTSHSAPYYAQHFRLSSSGVLYFGWNHNGVLQSLSTAGSNYSTNQWYYVAATMKSGEQKIYVDGSEIASGTNTPSITYYNQEIWIGQGNFGGYFKGNLANVAFWNRALNSDEINSIMWKSYSDLDAVQKNGLQGWWALDDISGTDVPDSSGNDNDGTAN